MYVGNFKNDNIAEKDEEISRFFKREEKITRVAETPTRENLPAEHPVDALAHWQAPEFEVYEQNKKWLLSITFLFIALIAYAIYTNSPIMAITFVLFGVVGYIHLGKEPRILDFIITPDGIIAGNEIFKYEQIKSFWIFYETNDLKVISLHLDSYLTPYIHIPIHTEDPVRIREILLEHIAEIKQEQNIISTLERFLGI